MHITIILIFTSNIDRLFGYSAIRLFGIIIHYHLSPVPGTFTEAWDGHVKAINTIADRWALTVAKKQDGSMVGKALYVNMGIWGYRNMGIWEYRLCSIFKLFYCRLVPLLLMH